MTSRLLTGRSPCTTKPVLTRVLSILFGAGVLAGCGDPVGLEETARPEVPAQGRRASLWTTGELLDSWGDKTGIRYAATNAINRSSPSALLRFHFGGAALRFGYLNLDNCLQAFGDRRVCSMSVRVGEDHRRFNVEERDRWLQPGFDEGGPVGGSVKLLQQMVLRGIRRGDGDVRVLLDVYGEGDVLFRFPLLGGCDALASIGLIQAYECGTGETTEPVTLAAWEQHANLEGRCRALLPNVTFTYHEPTELLSFWLLERYECAIDRFDIRRPHRLFAPTRHLWTEVANDGEGKREFVPVSAFADGGERLIITENGNASGRFRNTPDPEGLSAIDVSHLAPDHMSVGIRDRWLISPSPWRDRAPAALP